jgi:hypothetical protein
MATIRFVLQDDVQTVEADRVVGDSQILVAERRNDGAWLRVLALQRAEVRAVERHVGQADTWLVEDVRTSAGLTVSGEVAPGAVSRARLPHRVRLNPMARRGDRR